jgi:hypothetical protein
MDNYKRILVLKSRQLGISTGVSVSFLDDVLFTTNIQALSIFQTFPHAVDAFENKISFAWENLDARLKEALEWSVETNKANQLKFGFGQSTYSSYAVATSGRSGTFNKLHISELSTVCAERPIDATEIITGTLPTVPQSGQIIIESTAKGEEGDFAEMWRQAEMKQSNWHPIFLNWRNDVEEISKVAVIPRGDLPTEFQEYAKLHTLSDKELNFYYIQFLLLKKDWTLLLQEFPTVASEAFQGSGEKLFDLSAILEYEKYTEDGEHKGNFTIFEPPKDGHVYVIGADGAEGVGGDSSAAVVWKITGNKPKVVAVYASDSVSPEDFGYILCELGERYNQAILAPESNHPGLAIISVLRRKYDEDRIFRETDGLRLDMPLSQQLGFRTTGVSKETILSNFAVAVREFSVDIPSKQLLLEMRICPRGEMQRTSKNGSQSTQHYDIMMAGAIGLHAVSFGLQFKQVKQQNVFAHKASFDPYAGV